jgi:beta-lactam-binding protein with PASTA domain
VDEARRILTAQGFKVQFNGNFGTNLGSVFDESPSPGQQAPYGSTISLDVNLLGIGNHGNGNGNGNGNGSGF